MLLLHLSAPKGRTFTTRRCRWYLRSSSRPTRSQSALSFRTMSIAAIDRTDRLAPGTRAFPLLSLTATFLGSFLLLCGQSSQFGLQPRLITRFCYNSPNLSTINSQCVLCNYYTFDATLLGCTGTTALTVNITASQAFCVISQCLGQVRQSPVFLGRRKRDAANNDDLVDTRGFGNGSHRFSIVKEVDADVFFEDD